MFSTSSSHGGPDVLDLVERPTPHATEGTVRLRVHGAGVNRADVLHRQGRYPPPAGAPTWPGLEVSGVIDEVGPGVSGWHIGDEACALLPSGGYAQYAVVDVRHVLAVPAGVTLTEAAGVMEAACTVWSAFRDGDARPGQTVLVHGGSGGIGSLAIQCAAALGLTVIATAGDHARARRCQDLGADITIDYRIQDFVHAVRDAGGADLIVDVVGAAYLERNLAALRDDGTIVLLGLLGGRHAQIDLGALLARRARLIGTTLRSRSNEAKADIIAGVRDDIWPLIPDQVRPVLHGTVPLADAARAHRALEAGDVFGKLVLLPP